MSRLLLTFHRTLPAVALIAISLSALAEEPLAIPTDGEPFRAKLASVQTDWQFEFTTESDSRKLAGDDLVAWGKPVDPVSGIQVLTVGGGLIVTNSVKLAGESLSGAAASLGAWSLPIDVCAGIVLRATSGRNGGEAIRRRILSAKGRGDRLLLDNGDELTGTITALSETAVTLRREGDPLEVKLDTLAAIAFDPSLLAAPQTSGLRAIVGLNDGSQIVAGEMTADSRNAKLKVAGGGELQTATAWIAFVQMLGGRAVYLSDLEPASYRHLPLLTLSWPYHNDLNVRGSQLRSGGRPYFKGLGLHSPARITYDLAGKYQRFEADVAVDDSAGPRGSVAFRVFVDDGTGGWQERFTSPIIRGGEAPQRIAADVSGAKRISLLVDFADRGDELDHADWLDARLIK